VWAGPPAPTRPSAQASLAAAAAALPPPFTPDVPSDTPAAFSPVGTIEGERAASDSDALGRGLRVGLGEQIGMAASLISLDGIGRRLNLQRRGRRLQSDDIGRQLPRTQFSRIFTPRACRTRFPVTDEHELLLGRPGSSPADVEEHRVSRLGAHVVAKRLISGRQWPSMCRLRPASIALASSGRRGAGQRCVVPGCLSWLSSTWTPRPGRA